MRYIKYTVFPKDEINLYIRISPLLLVQFFQRIATMKPYFLRIATYIPEPHEKKTHKHGC